MTIVAEGGRSRTASRQSGPARPARRRRAHGSAPSSGRGESNAERRNPPRLAIGAEPLRAVVLAGAVAVVTLWWFNTPTLETPAQWLINAGRVTGLLAGYAVVILLALMARVPAIERGVGSDRLARWHAMGGRYTVGLASAHAMFILWGYTVEANTSVVEQSKTLLLTYPGVMTATAALSLFLMVGAASARAARRRMRYETWMFVHFYTYLAVALSFSHQLATGAEFVNAPLARGVWWSLYLGVAMLVVWFRWLTPVMSFRQHRLRVAHVYRESPDCVSVVVKGRNLAALGASGGQFFRWRFLTRDLWWSANPYSLSAAPWENEMRITVQEVGDHSRALARLRPGTRVFAEGPYGALSTRPRKGRPVLLIAGGLGITPMRALLETIPARRGRITLLYRTSEPGDVLFGEELDALAETRGARLLYATGPRGGQRDPTRREVLTEVIPSLERHEVYICASPGLTSAFVATLREVGVPQSSIHTESFEF